MKIFLKRVNRGLLLSAICLIVLIIYISIDYITFSTKKDAIRQRATDYVTAVAASNVIAGDFNQHKDQISSVINEYWCDQNIDSTAFNASDLKSQLTDLEDDNFFDILTASASIKSIKISKAGPNIALAQIKYTIDTTGKGNSILFAPASIVPLNYNQSGYAEIDSTNPDSYYDLSCSCQASAYLIYDNGKWNISTWDSYITDSTYNEHEEN